jgi:hypothetical protein
MNQLVLFRSAHASPALIAAAVFLYRALLFTCVCGDSGDSVLLGKLGIKQSCPQRRQDGARDAYQDHGHRLRLWRPVRQPSSGHPSCPHP